MITVIDYGIGNIGSILNMIKKAGGKAQYTSEPSEIDKADKLILAGVGSFDAGIRNLKLNDLDLLLKKKVLDDEIPILGICLGMQLMTNKSEEGILDGLGWIDAKTIKFNFGNNAKYKIPHMGWNTVTIDKGGPLFKNIDNKSRFYFVHSYHVVCNNPEDILTTTEYGINFVSSFQKENIMATQFHPEKSLRYGLMVMKNFVELEV